MDNWRLIDFAPVIMALVVSGLGLGLARFLVFWQRRQMAHPGTRRPHRRQAGEHH